MLNSKSPVPLYHQLADILTERIRSGEYSPGQMIPSEISLAKQYGIGRPTVRQAMDTLVRKGLIHRRRGAGTFVKRPEAKVDLFSLAGTSQAFLTQGIRPGRKMISPLCLKTVEGDPENPFNGHRAFFLSRLTLAQDRPILVEDIFLDAELFLGLDKIDLRDKSLSRVVMDHYYLKPENGVQTFKVEALSGTRAKLLGLTRKDPVLVVKREINFPDAPGAVYSVLFCRTDTFAFSQTIPGEVS
ncbi:GntR family transcriptional regulator [Desulfospira joergensenii]|uniref:GntR family transcriptional regulator n=1 Tax=Desulfospira joergensenii TaxID=53329 RepID=UPI0003B6BD7B|nr:GntR family transcriptional regulator [Desulfospira joergensenii]